MNIIHNQNVAFRCPNTLKEKLQQYAEEHDIRVSSVIRNACVAFLRKEQSGNSTVPALIESIGRSKTI